jgi:hypothetical protein
MPVARSFALAAVSATVVDAPAAKRAIALTVYDGALSVVADARPVSLGAGTVTLRFPGVSPMLDASSPRLLDPEGRSPEVTTQGFSGETLNAGKLLERYLGKAVEVRMPAEGDRPARLVEAVLLATDGPVVRIDGKVYLKPPGEIVLPELPAGLLTSPTLFWTIKSAAPFEGRLTAAYLARGLSWQADYTLTLDAAGTAGALQGWATVANQSGTDYASARLTVVAGRLNRTRPFYYDTFRAREAPMGGEFTPGQLGEFHRYDLKGRTTLENGATRQIALLAAPSLAVTPHWRFESMNGQTDDQPRSASWELTFDNAAAQGLGLPLPAGKVRVYRGTALLGEDSVANTPKGEAVKVRLGEAFDLVGTHRLVETTRPADKVRVERYEVVLRNHRAKAASVEVVEHPVGAWTVTEKNRPYRVVSATEIVFPVTVAPGGTETVTYTLKVNE